MLSVFRRNPQAPTIEALYGAIVAQARAAVFYLDYRVPDTVNGRLDMLMLHLALVFDRLSQGNAEASALGQGLFDRFCRDMDDHLREQGVSDLKVPKEMRSVGAAFFGRMGAYLSALHTADEQALREALSRNVYLDLEGAPAGRLGAYMARAHAELAVHEPASLASGQLSWPDPATIRPER